MIDEEPKPQYEDDSTQQYEPVYQEPAVGEEDTGPVIMTYYEPEEPLPFSNDFLDSLETNSDFGDFDDLGGSWFLQDTVDSSDESFEAEPGFEEVSYDGVVEVIDEIIKDERIAERMYVFDNVLAEFQKLVGLYSWMFADGIELFRLLLESESETRSRLQRQGKPQSQIDTIIIIRQYGLTVVARRLPLFFPTKFAI